MKKLMASAIAFLSIAGCSSPKMVWVKPGGTQDELEQMVRTERARRWTKYVTDKGHVFYYDATSLSHSGPGYYATVREWVEYEATENLSNVWRTTTIKCHDNSYSFNNILILDKQGQIRKPQADPTEWKTFTTGSPIFLLSKKICTQ
jgi:hypothetical protein